MIILLVIIYRLYNIYQRRRYLRLLYRGYIISLHSRVFEINRLLIFPPRVDQELGNVLYNLRAQAYHWIKVLEERYEEC